MCDPPATYGPLLPGFTVDPDIKSSRDLLITFARSVLVDERHPHTAVAHPMHQFPCTRPLAVAGQDVAGVVVATDLVEQDLSALALADASVTEVAAAVGVSWVSVLAYPASRLDLRVG
jgi:hypothetical protein